MAAWKKRVYKLDANHKWKARPGYQIFVADWGAVRFDIPRGWVPVPVEVSIRLCNTQPPDDDAALEVSVTHLAPIDWSDLSLAYLLRELAKTDKRGPVVWASDVSEEKRGELEIAWRWMRWIDATEGREACSYSCLARRKHTQVYLTYDYWRDQETQFAQVWPNVLESLQVGEQPPGLGKRGPRL